MRIQVTKKDIELGKPANNIGCPLALALLRAYGREIKVGRGFLFIDNPFNKLCDLPSYVQDFVYAFDNRLDVEPFEFDLELPK